MPEVAELYGVTWHDRGRGQFEAEVDGVKWAIVGGGLTIFRDGTSVTQYKEVSTFARAAMIVALLARPDAQFELVEKSDA